MCQWHPFLHSSVHTLAVVVVHKPVAVGSAAVVHTLAVVVVRMPVAVGSAAVVHKLAAVRKLDVVRKPAAVAEPAEQICSRRCRQ